MCTLLHDGGALAVILADDHQRAAGDAARRDVGKRIRRHVGANHRLPCDGTAQRIIDGSREHGCSSGLAGRSEEHTSELQSLMRISYAVFCLQKKKLLIVMLELILLFFYSNFFFFFFNNTATTENYTY